jgi:hypothetical protein
VSEEVCQVYSKRSAAIEAEMDEWEQQATAANGGVAPSTR